LTVRRAWLATLVFIALAIAAPLHRMYSNDCADAASLATQARIPFGCTLREPHTGSPPEAATIDAASTQAVDCTTRAVEVINCSADGIPLAAFVDFILTSATALTSWAAYRVALWVVRGFRAA